MKKILCTLLVVVMCLTSAPLGGFVGIEWPEINFGEWFGSKASATSYTEGYYTYTVNNGEATITDVNTSISGDVIIPATLGGYSVTTIGEEAFHTCYSLTSITIGDGVTIIGDRTFAHCESMTSITIPDSVTTIGADAFCNCYSLTSVIIPDSVTTIGFSAFNSCYSLKNILVDIDNQFYSSDSFGVLYNKNKTELVQYPIGNYATSYTIPDSVTTIDSFAFEHCVNLTSIIVDSNNAAYSSDNRGVLFNKNKTMLIQYPIGNSDISYIIPDGVETIASYAFCNCDSLANITMPESITTIKAYAFSGCSSLTNMTIPKSVTTIGMFAFLGCIRLASIIVCVGVETIGWCTFSGCESLKDIYYQGTEEQWENINISRGNSRLLDATIHYNSSENELTENLVLNHEILTIKNNRTPWLEVISYPDGVTEDDIIWTSSNERVAYISNDIVHPNQYGKTLITVSTKDGRYSASCEVTVQSSFVITSINSSLSGLKTGEEAEYTIMLMDYEGNKLPVKDVTILNEDNGVMQIVKQERTDTEIKLKVKALKVGTDVIWVQNDEPETVNRFVFDIYPATVTYRADKVPIRDEELKTNFSRSGMFVENFRYYAVGEPAEYYKALMNVYNKSSSVGVVASYTQDGQLYDITEVKKHQAMPTDYFEFLAVLGKGAVDIALLNTYNYRYSVESTKTEIEIKVPINGYLTVSNDIKSSPINFVYGMISVAVETAFQLAEDLTSIDGDKKSTVVKKLTKEVTDYFSKETDHFDELVEELSKDVIKNSSKMNIVSMGNYSLDVVSAIFEAMNKKFDDVLNSALNEVLKDSAHTFIKMSMMKDFIDNKAIDKVTGGYIKAGEIMFSAAEHFNIVAEIIDLIHSAYSGETTVTFGKCNEDGFICKDTIKVNLKEEQEVLDAIYLQHYQIYINKNQLTLRPEIKDLNLKENSVVEVHEITVMRDGVPYEIKQEVSVEVDIPDGWATFNFKIYRVEADGKLTNMFARVANGKAYFTTDHFSEYIFVGELEDTHTHSYTATTVNPTCTEAGSITYTCTCGDTYTETIPATGHSFDGSECTSCGYDKADECDCNCHASGIKKFFFKLILFFQKLFKKNAVCACGVAHY